MRSAVISSAGAIRVGRGSSSRALLSSGFDPAAFAGLKLDLDAAKFVGKNDGDALSAWNDSSGQGNNFAQATGGFQPLYKTAIFGALPAARFDGVDDHFRSAASLAAVFPSAATLYIVAQLSAENIYSLYTTTGNSTFWRFSDNTGYQGAFRAVRIDNYPASGFMPTTGKHVFCVRSDASAYQLFKDGAGAGARAAGYSAGTIHTLGCGTDGSNNVNASTDLTGDIARVLGYSAAHSDSDVAAVSAALKTLYGTA